jgi:uncharacterized protein
VKRPDAVELIAIRSGAWSYDKLIGFAEEQEQHLLEVAKKSELPKRPNRKKLDQLCCEITEMVENR